MSAIVQSRADSVCYSTDSEGSSSARLEERVASALLPEEKVSAAADPEERVSVAMLILRRGCL